MLISQKNDQQKLDCENQNKWSDFLNIFKAGGEKKKDGKRTSILKKT